MDNKNEKPKHFLIFKIIGITGVILTIIGFVLIFTGFGNFDNNNFMIGAFLSTFSFGMAFIGLIKGFEPEIAKLKTKTTKYIQEENKEDLKDIASNTADITSEAITTTTKSIKKGLKDTKYCKHCGKEIDKDSKFCSHCGKEQ